METKELLKYAAIAVGGYLVYHYVIAPMLGAVPATASGASPGSAPATPTGANPVLTIPTGNSNGQLAPSQISDAAAAAFAAQRAAALAAQQQAAADAEKARLAAIAAQQVVNSTFASSDYGSGAWINRVGTLMTEAANGQGRRIGDWSWYYQNPANGSPISAALYGQIVDDGGGDDNKVVTAVDFLNLLIGARAKGVSGLGEIVQVPYGLGTFWGVN